MKAGRCPYHVRQGFADNEGNLVLSDVCGVKSACGANCPLAPFKDAGFKSCPTFSAQQRGSEREMLIPKNDMEYLPELGGVANLSEMDLL